MVVLKFEGIWRTEQWVPASCLEMSEGLVEHPMPMGLKRPWHEVPGEKKKAIPTRIYLLSPQRIDEYF